MSNIRTVHVTAATCRTDITVCPSAVRAADTVRVVSFYHVLTLADSADIMHKREHAFVLVKPKSNTLYLPIHFNVMKLLKTAFEYHRAQNGKNIRLQVATPRRSNSRSTLRLVARSTLLRGAFVAPRRSFSI